MASLHSSLPHNTQQLSSSRKKKKKFVPTSMHGNEVGFRVLCDDSTSRALSFVFSKLCHETGTKIYFYDPLPDYHKRVIAIIGDKDVYKTLDLENAERKEGVVLDVSRAQKALMMVVAKILDIERGNIGCYLLANDSQIGPVLGKSGENVRRMKTLSGADIRVLQSPSSALIGVHMISIAGDYFAMNKALHEVSGCLQNCPPTETFIEKPQIVPRPKDATPSDTLPRALSYFFSDIVLTKQQYVGYSFEHPTSSYPDTNVVDAVDIVERQQKVVFRLLCPGRVVGGIIGVTGSTIRAMQNETGARITIAEAVGDCDERVITVTALEDVRSSDSPAQHGTFRVLKRLVEIDGNSQVSQFHLNNERVLVARLLIEGLYIGCLGGNEGKTISKIKAITSANIRIFEGQQVPQCAGKDDFLGQISGEYKAVQDALFLITGKLRANLFSNEVLIKRSAKASMSSIPRFSTDKIMGGKQSSKSHQTMVAFADSSQKTSIVQGVE